MNNFNNKIKFIIGNKTLLKIPFELEKYNSSHALVFIEFKKDLNKIKKLLHKTLKNTHLKIELCCLEKYSCKEKSIEFLYNYIRERKNKSIITVGSSQFINTVNAVRIMIVKNSDSLIDLKSESYCYIPMIAIPYKTIDLSFASANIIINNKIIDLEYIEDLIIICDRKLLKNNFNKNIDKYFCAIYKALIATVNDTNILVMPANKAVIQCIIDNLLILKREPHNKNAFFAIEEAVLVLNIGEERQKYNCLSQMIRNLSDVIDQQYKILCEAAPKYLIHYQENEVFNNILKTLIHKYKINCADKDITIAFFDYIENLRKTFIIDKEVNKTKLKKENVIKTYKETASNNISDAETLMRACNALVDICE